MAAYNYTREKIVGGDYDNRWDIPNPNRLDGGDQIYLEDEIKAASGTITKPLSAGCSMVCDGASCSINFAEILATEEEAALTVLVNAHKNNTQ